MKANLGHQAFWFSWHGSKLKSIYSSWFNFITILSRSLGMRLPFQQWEQEDGVVGHGGVGGWEPSVYRKHMATPFPMTDMSTMPSKVKKTMMVQEVVRIRRDLRQGLPWNVTVKHLNNFCQRMKASRYDQSNRFQVLKSGVEGFEKMLEVKRGGGRPINRQRSWEEEERQKKKELQSKVWFKGGGFDVPLLFSTHSERRTCKENTWGGSLSYRCMQFIITMVGPTSTSVVHTLIFWTDK